MRSLRVLVVDDGFMAASLTPTLVEAGHEVIGPVTSAEEAMELAGEKKPQLAFVDINKHGSGSGPRVAYRCEELGIPTMFLIGCKVNTEPGEAAAGLLSDPHFLNDLLAVVEYIRSEGRSVLSPQLFKTPRVE